jgi:hypothetical protein
VHAPGETLPNDVEGLLASVNRVDFAIDVATYGKGGLSFIVA